jgi:hypothetical protein
MTKNGLENVPFWMVFAEGGGPPTFQHKSYGAAEKEAERLANANPGTAFFVMMPVTRKRRIEVETEVLFDLDDGIPF